MHLAALSQIRYPDTAGRVYYDRKVAEGKTGKEAFRALKRRISDAVYRQLVADDRAIELAREGNQGRLSRPARPASHPDNRLFGSATPGPRTPRYARLEPRRRRGPTQRAPTPSTTPLDNKEEFVRFVVVARRCRDSGGRSVGNRRPERH